jgi:serine/threonine protein kinase
VMQYVAGASLQHRIERQGALKVNEVVRISMQVARGLAAAHAQGIVHRDIKPANILLEHGLDRALVTDFGLARVADDASETMSGVLAGTPSFMAPEQARGERIDERSDLFSLGSVMYAMCTARPPFRAETVYGMIRRICEDETRPIRDINPEIPEWLAAFVTKLHSKAKENRFESAEQVGRVLSLELAHLQNPASIGAPARPWLVPPVVPRAKGRLAGVRSMGAAFLTAVLAIAGLSYLLQATALQKEDGDEQAQIANPENAANDSNDVNANVNADVNADANVNVNSEVQVNADVEVESTSQSESRTNGKRQYFENTEERSFPAQSGGQLTVDVDFGAMEVTTGEEDQVRVRAIRKVKGSSQKAAEEMVSTHKLEFMSDGRDLTLKAGFRGDQDDWGSRSLDVRFEISVPKKYNVDLKTNGGHLEVGDLEGQVKLHTSGGHIELGTIQGPIHAHTSGGHIELEQCQSDAELRTSGGSIIAGPVHGALIAETSGGHIRLDRATGRVSANTSGGNVEINNAEGEVEAITSGGNVKATITKQPKKDCKLETSGGNISIRVAKDVALRIEAKTDHGRIRSPFPTKRDQSDNQQTVSGNLGEGGPTLKATTHAGNVSIEYLEEEAVEAP